MKKKKSMKLISKILKIYKTEYETKASELKREYKSKEENLKKKYENLEELVNKRTRDNEFEYTEKIEKLQHQLKENVKIIEKLEKENISSKEANSNLEKFMQTKEEEFENILMTKDKKLKELELCIKAISDDANNQINKLSDSIMDYNEKIGYYKSREAQLLQEVSNMKNKSLINLNDLSPIIHTKEKIRLEKDRHSNTSINLDNEYKKTIEKLRNRIKEIEEENMV